MTRRRTPAAAGLAAVLVVAALALGYRALRRGPPAEAQGSFAPFKLAAPGTSGIPKLPGSSSDERALSDYEELAALLTDPEQPPAVKRFISEFKKDPKLNGMLDEFEEDQEGDAPQGTIEGFARALVEKAEFRRLVSKFSQEPGFRQLAVPLSRFPQLRSVVTDAVAMMKGRGRRSGVAGSAEARARGSAGQASSFVAAAAAPAPAGGARRTGAATPPKGGAAPVQAGEEPAGTVPLESLPNVNGSSGPSAWESLCFQHDRRLSKKLCKVMKDLVGDPYTVWGACFAGGVYQECVKACKETPELRCSDIPSWFEACLEAERPLSECEKRCKSDPRPGCPEESELKKFHWLGYDQKDGKLVVNEKEKQMLLRMYRSYDAGESLAAIASALNADGLTHKFGNRFTAGSVATVMRRRLYLGEPDRAPQLIPTALWNRVNRRLDRS